MIKRYEIYNLTTRTLETTGMSYADAVSECTRLNEANVYTRDGERYRLAVQPAGFLTDGSFRAARGPSDVG